MTDIAPREPTPLEASLGYRFTSPELLSLALTHKSFAYEQNGGVNSTRANNERLEFLGDAVLDLALGDLLMRAFPDDTEGALSKKRASLVNEETLARLALGLKLEELVRLGKGETKTGGLFKPRILASGLEAVFGAIFLDAGFTGALDVVARLFEPLVTELAVSTVDYQLDFKTRLQEMIQEKRRATPTYRIETESGPDHDKTFEVSVWVAGEVLGYGTGKSKKAAEQDAARQALEKMK
jgi:ribonuclease-3